MQCARLDPGSSPKARPVFPRRKRCHMHVMRWRLRGRGTAPPRLVLLVSARRRIIITLLYIFTCFRVPSPSSSAASIFALATRDPSIARNGLAIHERRPRRPQPLERRRPGAGRGRRALRPEHELRRVVPRRERVHPVSFATLAVIGSQVKSDTRPTDIVCGIHDRG
jgi:hypothetical protein